MPAFKMHPNATKLYLPSGTGPKPGDVFRNPDLAQFVKRIAVSGRDGFYKGRTAEAIVAISKELGGTMTMADLAEFEPEWVEPISTTIAAGRSTSCRPTGRASRRSRCSTSWSTFRWPSTGTIRRTALHVMIEAKKLAYADMLRYVGDPRFSNDAGERDAVEATRQPSAPS